METSISQKALKTLDMSFFHKPDEDQIATGGDLINDTLVHINMRYPSGLIASLRERPDDWSGMIAIEDKMDYAALEGNKGDLVMVLKEYENFFDKMTRSFLHSINAVAIPQQDSKKIENRKEVRKMKTKDMFPSKYLGKEDIPEPRVLTIRECGMEDIENEDGVEAKPVLYFKEYGDRGMILNKTNATTLEDLYGDSDDWPNKLVEIYVDPTIRFGKQKRGGVRMRPPAQPSPQQEV